MTDSYNNVALAEWAEWKQAASQLRLKQENTRPPPKIACLILFSQHYKGKKESLSVCSG